MFPDNPNIKRSNHIDMKIEELNISAGAKSALISIGFTEVSELTGQNYITLKDKFPSYYDLEPIIKEFNSIGYLSPPSTEVCVRDIPMTGMLRNTLIRNGVLYLSQLSVYAKEDILRFKRMGEKSFMELEQLCKEYGIEIRTLLSIKESFGQCELPGKIYSLFFENHIFCPDDFNHMTAYDLFELCLEDYPLTMRTYNILSKNGFIFEEWQDKYIFEFLSAPKASLIWRTFGISMLSQIPYGSENQLKKIPSTPNVLKAKIKAMLEAA